MARKNIIRQVYLVITLIITAQFILVTWHSISTTKEAVLKDKERDLIEIVAMLENKLPKAYDDLLEENQSRVLSDQEKQEVLNKHLQPIVDAISLKWPGYGMGYYSKDLNILALAPYNKDMLGRTASAEALKVYERKELTISSIQNGFTWGGHTILGANEPLFKDGQLIGHVWANIKIDNINSTIFNIIILYVLLYILIWAAMILTIGWSIKKIEKSLTKLITKINCDTELNIEFGELPQLIPVYNTVQNLKMDLQKEYEERHRVQSEIARLDRLNIIGEMAATVAHEIRNPMTVVMGYIQLIAKKDKNNSNEVYGLIIDELKRVNQIIEDFLSLARVREMPKSSRQINDIIQSSYNLIYAEGVNKGIDITMDLQSSLPTIYVDEKEIKQVILNLACNSIEAMESGGDLRISNFYKEGENFITLEIHDNGPGIAEEELVKIFNPFYTTKENGTGLGLSVCHNIVKKYGGSIAVNSIPQEGTTFSIILPIDKDLN